MEDDTKKDLENLFNLMVNIESIDQLPIDNLKDELRVMPGSFLKKIIETWQEVKTPIDHRRSIRYLRRLLIGNDIPSIYDKMRGYTGIQKSDARTLLICLFDNWDWSEKETKNIPMKANINVPVLIEKLLDLLFLHHKKLLLIRFEGQDVFRFLKQSPENYRITFVSSAHQSLLYSTKSQGVISNFHRAMLPYLKEDKEKTKGVYTWVLDLGNTHVGDKDSFKRYQNLWNVAGALRSLQLFNPNEAKAPQEGLFLTPSDADHHSRMNTVRHAFDHRMAIIVRNVPDFIKKKLIEQYKETDGDTEPKTDKSYIKLRSDFGDLTADNFVLPSPLTLWPHDSSLKMFLPLDYDGDDILTRLAVTNCVLVEPSSNMDSPELEAQYWCVGHPVSRGDRGRSSAFTDESDSFMAVNMSSPSFHHDKAFHLLYFAVSHRLGRSIFSPEDNRGEIPLISESHVIWALRRMGFEVMSARSFLNILCMEET